MERIKVLYILSGAHLYGDNRSILQTILANKDNVNAFVCTTEEGALTEILKSNQIKYYIVSSVFRPNISSKRSTFRVWFGRVRRMPLAYYKLSKIIKEISPDIIHSNNSIIFSGYIMAKKFQIPHVWHVREYQTLDHNYTNRYLDKEKKWMTKSYCIGITKGIFDFWNMQSPKDIQLYNGIYSDKEMLPYIFEKEDYFLYSGRIIPTKGVHEMLEAFGQFCGVNKTTKLLLAGDFKDSLDYKKQLNDIIEKYQIQDRVEFLGFVKDMRPLMRVAKALIVPSFFEAMGRITAEAMLMGCFVIGRNTAGTKELLEYEKTGCLFNNTHELYEAIKNVALMNNQNIANLTIPVMEKAQKHYSAETNAANVYEYYKKILNV